jgi:hypothetical protein
MVRTDSGTEAGAPSAIGVPGTVVDVEVDVEEDEPPHPASTVAATAVAHAAAVHLPLRRISLPRFASRTTPAVPPDRATAPP